MVEENVEWFGDLTPNVAVRVTDTATQAGTIIWAATLNGQPWTGSVNVNGTTPNGPVANYPIPTGTYYPLPKGAYTYSYASGGPPGSTFQNITPSGSQALPSNGTITFTFNFIQ